MSLSEQKYYSMKEVAGMKSMSVDSIRRQILDGFLQCEVLLTKGNNGNRVYRTRRISHEEIVRWTRLMQEAGRESCRRK
jgi:hypothetical protein